MTLNSTNIECYDSQSCTCALPSEMHTCKDVCHQAPSPLTDGHSITPFAAPSMPLSSASGSLLRQQVCRQSQPCSPARPGPWGSVPRGTTGRTWVSKSSVSAVVAHAKRQERVQINSGVARTDQSPHLRYRLQAVFKQSYLKNYYHSSFHIHSSEKITPENGCAPVFIKIVVIYLEESMLEKICMFC